MRVSCVQGTDLQVPPALTVERAVVLRPADVIRDRLAGLRRHTAPYHKAVERQFDIIGRLRSVDRYIDLLVRLYGFYEPFEAALGAAVERWALPFDFDARRKSPLIARDLVISWPWGWRPPASMPCRDAAGRHVRPARPPRSDACTSWRARRWAVRSSRAKSTAGSGLVPAMARHSSSATGPMSGHDG